MANQTNKEVFFGALAKAFKEQWHVDVHLKSGDDETAIPTHKVVLAARSKVFRDMLESDECKKTSQDETITLSELKHKELEALLEFIYNGSLPFVKLKEHVRSLYRAAHKYEIPYLQDVCRGHLISCMQTSNAIDILELSVDYSDEILKDAAVSFIAKDVKKFAYLDEFKEFVKRNPSVAVLLMHCVFFYY